MNQLIAITKNTYLQVVRQPVYGIIVIVTLGGLALAPAMTGWTLDDDNKMLRDIGLSTLLMQGLFLACFAASSVLDHEIEDKTVLTITAKPVSRSVFILGKYLGVMGGLLTAQYLASIAFFMAMRHGVLQSAAEKSDITVLLLGPGVMLLAAAVAVLMNYVYERRFLPTLVFLAVPFMTLSTLILLVMDRDFGLQSYETTHDIAALPAEAVPADSLRGIVDFRPDEGNRRFEGHSGKLVRSFWKGPITEEDRLYLLNLVDDVNWRKIVTYLAKDTRELETFEVLKASVLILFAIALLTGIAVACSTRLGVVSTFLINILVVILGLASDQVFKPLADAGTIWATIAYRLVPNLQCFWMVDALMEERTIPLSYLASTGGYAFLYILATLLLAMSLFETREVG
ncbi:MAG: hypothetical protein ACE5EC_10905 [Phycisphaerae bacterium]